MNEVQSAEIIKKLLSPFLENGFTFRYFHEKGGDSSCVYISRFQKGKDYFDWRETSGTNEIHFVVYAQGQYLFPALEKRHKKAFRSFAFKHLFKKATMDEKRTLYASALKTEWEYAKPTGEFFGIRL